MSLSKWLPCDFEQCHPLLWGGGILVDHWSTISSYLWAFLGNHRLKHQNQDANDNNNLFRKGFHTMWTYSYGYCVILFHNFRLCLWNNVAFLVTGVWSHQRHGTGGQCSVQQFSRYKNDATVITYRTFVIKYSYSTNKYSNDACTWQGVIDIAMKGCICQKRMDNAINSLAFLRPRWLTFINFNCTMHK